uniref:Uncharacterized protein n=1 Tax=Leersia perrieri TaxID=77586 RepID=A0A0D9XY59_9ORYZ
MEIILKLGLGKQISTLLFLRHLNMQVLAAEVYIIGRVDQGISSYDIPTDSLTWPEFCSMTCKRFSVKSTVDVTDTFRNLKHPWFKLMSMLAILMEALQHQNLLRPTSSNTRLILPTHSKRKTGLLNKLLPPHLLLSCLANTSNEPWLPGYGRVCKASKQIYFVTMEEDDDDDQPSDALPHSTPEQQPSEQYQHVLSMQAIDGNGVGSTTFCLHVQIGTVSTMVLVDSGSTTTFMSPTLVRRAHLDITIITPLFL